MARKIRTTISIDPEVLAVYRQMAERSGLSLSQCIGGWLEDTLDSAQLINQKMTEARGIPSRFVRSMEALIDGAESAMGQVVADMALPPQGAPSSNTGLNYQKNGVRNAK